MIHKDIRIKFEVDGRRYEAVGFLNEGENLVPGEEMLRRTAAENGGAIGDDDVMFLSERLDKFAERLFRSFCLFTNHRHPNNHRLVSFFDRIDVFPWGRHWGSLDNEYSSYCLVLRRCL